MTKANFETEFNSKCAEFMGYRFDIVFNQVLCAVDGDISGREFDPPTDANDLNLVIENMEINVVKFGNRWQAATDNTADESVSMHEALNKDRTTAIIKCVCSVLGIEYEQ